MSVESLITRTLSATRRHLYRGWLKRALQGSKVGNWFIRGYWAVFTTLISQRECSVANTRAVFKIDNRREYKRITDLGDEEPILNDLIGRLHNDDVFFDVGANIGLYSCLVGRSIPDGQVIAFEPHPKNLGKLQKNMSVNGVRGRTLQFALSDVESVVPFDLGEGEAGVGKSSMVDSDHCGKKSVMNVRTVPGDTLIERGEVPSPSVMKVDVEGAEAKVLNGLSETLNGSSCRLVYCEIHHDKLHEFESTAAEIRQQFREAGFELSMIYERDSTSFIRAAKSE